MYKFFRDFFFFSVVLTLPFFSVSGFAQEAGGGSPTDAVKSGFEKQVAPPTLQSPLAPEGTSPQNVKPSSARQVGNITQSTLYDNFQKGGVIMYLILLCSIGGFYITIEKFFVLRRSKVLPRKFINNILDFVFIEDKALASQSPSTASPEPGSAPLQSSRRFSDLSIPDYIMDSLNKIIDYCEGKDIPVAKVLKAGLLEFDEGIMGMKSAITSANMHESAVMEKGLSLLGMLGNIAPLLGLLGTVTGMISAFEMISIGGSGRPEIVASGISMALVTTAGGLFVGIPLVLAYHFIQNKIENLLVDLQEFSVDVSEKLFRECRR